MIASNRCQLIDTDVFGPAVTGGRRTAQLGSESEGWIYLLYEGGGGQIARFNLSWLLEGEKISARLWLGVPHREKYVHRLAPIRGRLFDNPINLNENSHSCRFARSPVRMVLRPVNGYWIPK